MAVGESRKQAANSNGFVQDGFERARAAAEPEIRAQVVAEYAERLEAASSWKKYWLWRAIDREVETRLARQAPPGALY
ncbi:MAG: hypothetical protein DWQ37_05605 [Planctomycetota bacterium]|nr:MAG: hypothetical protein DWQ37_05605 [Planctomycetota bacterium]